MEHSPSREVNWSSASQEIPCISWNPMVLHRFTTASHPSLSWTRL